MRIERLKRLAWVFAVLVGVMVGRLFQLQVIQAERWEREARLSRLDRDTLPFRRGRILDRDGEVLAEDRPSYDLYFRYRDFRREHVFGQLIEGLLLLEVEVPGGLVAMSTQGEAYADLLLNLTGADLAAMPGSRRGDLLFYLKGAAEADRGPVEDALDALVEGADPRPLALALPPLSAGIDRRLDQARRDWQVLERTLGPEWEGLLLTRLEERRRKLALMVARAIVQEAAARATDLAPWQLRARIDPIDEEGAALLARLAARWQLQGDPADLATLLLAKESQAPDGDPDRWLAPLRALELQVARTQATDISGLRKGQTQRVHHLRVVSLVRDLDFSQVDLLAQMASTYPGLYLQAVTRRLYPGEVQPLVIGSVRLPTAEDLAAVQAERDRYRELGRMFYRSAAEEAEFRRLQHRQLSQALRPDESTGREGVERVYEAALRGQRGYVQVLKGGDEGLEPLELRFSPPQDGADVVLALDAALERAALEAIATTYARTLDTLRTLWPTAPPADRFDPERPKVGLVLLDLATGEVPLLTSTPTIAREEVRERWDELKDLRLGSPLRQRALGGGFPQDETPYPGSTFKALTAAAALSVDPNLWEQTYECLGTYTPIPNGNRLKCDARYGHDEIGMHLALVKSCNIYFYKLAERIGPEVLHDYAQRLGFGHATGIELVSQMPPTDPSGEPRWSGDAALERRVNYLAPLPDMQRDRLLTMRTAIGQQGIQASPLQMARFYAWLATGELPTPRLVREGAGLSPAAPPMEVPVLPERERRRIVQALFEVSYDQEGTAFRTDFPASWGIVGKTGTAQVRQGANPVPTHAWFTGFFPRDRPRYAFAVMCENTGLHGGQVASFVLKELLASEEGRLLLAEDDS
ncbi:MAG: penicillin-binding transpeptidase domain-containing protein [Planctomycetota bacterium]|jgi:cell division protein FtsI/penicillin-binding protein 2